MVAANKSKAVNAAMKLELAELQKAIAREERAWEDAVAKAAIEKEKIERRFVEPRPAAAARGNTGGGVQQQPPVRRQEREQPRPAPAAPAREMPPAPAVRKHEAELSIARAAREMTEAEGPRTKPDQLHGPAAEIWTAYNVRSWQREYERPDPDGSPQKVQDTIQLKARRDPFAFSDALDKQGSVLARVTKDEAERSAKEAAHWKQHEEYRSVYREREFVVIDRRGEIWRLNQRTTGEEFSRAQAFLEKADWKGALPGIDRAREIVKDREAQRQVERNTIRAEIDAGRLKRATTPGRSPANRSGRTPAAPDLAKAGKRTITGVVGALGKLADGFSLDGLTPREKHEAAKLRHANEREAEERFEVQAFIAERAKARQDEQQREEEHRQRQQRDRDRDRDR